MRIRANEILELTMRYQSYTFEVNAERGFSQRDADQAFRDFIDYTHILSLDMEKGKILATYGNDNYKNLKEAGTEYVEVEI